MKHPLIQDLENLATQQPDQTAIQIDGVNYSYQTLESQINTVALGLFQQGLGKDDRVGILLDNCVEFVVSFFATLKCGGIAVLLDPNDPLEKLQLKVDDTEPEFIVTHDYCFSKFKDVLLNKSLVIVPRRNRFKSKRLRALKGSIDVGLVSWFSDSYRNIIYYSEFFKRSFKQETINKLFGQQVTEQDIAVILFSQSSKGVKFSYRKLDLASRQNQCLFNLTNKETLFNSYPLHIGFGLSPCLIYPLLNQVKLILTNQSKNSIFSTLVNQCPNVMVGTSQFYEEVFNSPLADSINFDNLQICFTVDSLPFSTVQRIYKLTQAVILEGYALTETATIQCAESINAKKPHSIGRPMPDVEMDVWDLYTGTACKSGQYGELVIKTPTLCDGYWNYNNDLFYIEDGWLRTGDLGFTDSSGYYYYLNKLEDVLIQSTRVIVPKIVEQAINEFESVVESVVVIHNDSITETPYILAGVVSKGFDLADLSTYLESRIDSFMLPDAFFTIDKLKRKDNGRIDRFNMRIELARKFEKAQD